MFSGSANDYFSSLVRTQAQGHLGLQSVSNAQSSNDAPVPPSSHTLSFAQTHILLQKLIVYPLLFPPRSNMNSSVPLEKEGKTHLTELLGGEEEYQYFERFVWSGK